MGAQLGDAPNLGSMIRLAASSRGSTRGWGWVVDGVPSFSVLDRTENARAPHPTPTPAWRRPLLAALHTHPLLGRPAAGPPSWPHPTLGKVKVQTAAPAGAGAHGGGGEQSGAPGRKALAGQAKGCPAPPTTHLPGARLCPSDPAGVPRL